MVYDCGPRGIKCIKNNTRDYTCNWHSAFTTCLSAPPSGPRLNLWLATFYHVPRETYGARVCCATCPDHFLSSPHCVFLKPEGESQISRLILKQSKSLWHIFPRTAWASRRGTPIHIASVSVTITEGMPPSHIQYIYTCQGQRLSSLLFR